MRIFTTHSLSEKALNGYSRHSRKNINLHNLNYTTLSENVNSGARFFRKITFVSLTILVVKNANII